MQAVVRSGSANERSPAAGYSHFIEHLVFKSSKRFGFNQISNTVSKLGGSLNAYTDFDSTCYYLLLPSEHLYQGLEILAELLSGARFTAQDVSTEKEIILEEIDQYGDDPRPTFWNTSRQVITSAAHFGSRLSALPKMLMRPPIHP
jgi:zinc protease